CCAGKEAFLVEARLLHEAAQRMLPAMKRGFPKIEPDLIAIEKALKENRLDLERVAKNLLETKVEAIAETAGTISVEPKILKFVVGWCLKPFVERRAALMAPLGEQLDWSKGYCPICGSWPGLGLLKGQEGQRWVKCSFCSHEWRFMRTACPFCDNEDQTKLEYFFSQERGTERVEVCHQCKRYLVGMDLRDRIDEPVIEVAPLGLVYLDILAQRQGFVPGATTDWNVLDDDA
ncbi:MAG: formate dehydrogenase accessory protein FdhE, partial [Desulfomonile tiedjei]|nr:formate dehydrogenase accessory protein FdhE [Desulfomonile tiedjei]